MRIGVFDQEGFPRGDIDIEALLSARQKMASLQVSPRAVRRMPSLPQDGNACFAARLGSKEKKMHAVRPAWWVPSLCVDGWMEVLFISSVGWVVC